MCQCAQPLRISISCWEGNVIASILSKSMTCWTSSTKSFEVGAIVGKLVDAKVPLHSRSLVQCHPRGLLSQSHNILDEDVLTLWLLSCS